jgi:wobble nucleotide-excising tRNase
MIRKILKLQNIGLLQDATQTGAVELAKVTAIYAENGRGKSTFASMIRTCSQADIGRINARKTIDSLSPPEISLLLLDGSHVRFVDGVWVGPSPSVAVFDDEFVEQNIYSGFEVRPDQRQSLLEFVLGDETIRLKRQVDQLTQDIEAQTRKRAQAERIIKAYASSYSVMQFIALPQMPNVRQQIEALRERIESAKKVQQLSVKQGPTALALIAFDVQAVFDLLGKQLEDVDQHAEAMVRAHFTKQNAAGFEDWVSSGQEYLNLNECPFCGQSVNGLELIQSYRSYFNKAYVDLKHKIAAFETQVIKDFADEKIGLLRAVVDTNTARIEAWKDRLDLTVPTFALDELSSVLEQVSEQLLQLLAIKSQKPLEFIGSQAECTSITSAMISINQTIAAYNLQIETLATKIADYKRKLAAENTKELNEEIERLEVAQKRQFPEVLAAIDEYQAAEAERVRLENEKEQIRLQIDKQMQENLQQYQARINSLLTGFGADFSIEQLKYSYVGSGEPRTDYGLCLRNKSVKLGSRADLTTGHGFATALSAGDKRTLAFAFFFARLEDDSHLSEKVVVVHDPMSSLDRNRRHQSIRLIANLSTKCKQLIVLSHDSYFVRELREHLSDLKPVPMIPKILTIQRVQNGYSAFAPIDIDEVCASDYYRHHRLVADYVDGKSTANTRDVAKTLRPLLEGYYHRRFPGRIPRNLMFGQILSLVQQATSPNPLTYLNPVLEELKEVNDYVGQFHHDTNPSYETVSIVDGELVLFAQRTLKLIYQSG